jgi:hypothetical protein
MDGEWRLVQPCPADPKEGLFTTLKSLPAVIAKP